MKSGSRAPEGGTLAASRESVTAFRLSRHHLLARAPASNLNAVLREIGGAQAQVLSAAQIAVWARVRDVRLGDIEARLSSERTLARAWCMRRTMYLLPSGSLATFVRGSALRAEREVRWVLSRGVPGQTLEEVIATVLRTLDEPLTQTELAGRVSKSLGYRLRSKVGGGWGDRGRVACVEVGTLALSASYLLHLAGARGVICAGPKQGTETTFVRADRWARPWKDLPPKQAEEELLRVYLRAYGPATISDFIWWTGMFASDAKQIWSRLEEELADVEIDESKATVLKRDLGALRSAELEVPSVRLLPYFDSYLLGHRTKSHIVDVGHRSQVYRPQGWVAPVLLVDGLVRGIWSHALAGQKLAVRVETHSSLRNDVTSVVKEEAESLAAFLGCSDVKTVIERRGP